MRRVTLLVMTFILVFLLSSCGVEERGYSAISYLGLYNDDTYFVVPDQWDDNVRHLYRFKNEEFEHVKEFTDNYPAYFTEGVILLLAYDDSQKTVLTVYDIDADDSTEYTIPDFPHFGRIMNYHDGVLMLYTAGLQRSGDESLILYSLTTNEILTSIEGPEIDLGYGVGDFDSEYIYLANERSNSTALFKGVRIDRTTNDIEAFESPSLYISYGYENNQVFYQTKIADANVIFIDKNAIFSDSFFTMYNDPRLSLYFDEQSDSFIFSNREDRTITIFNDDTSATYNVEFNEYSYGFINDSTYYTISVKTYGSIYKREVAVIEIRSIIENKLLYTSDKVTTGNQSGWED